MFQYEDLTENILQTPNVNIEPEIASNHDTSMPDQPDSEPSNRPGDHASISPSNAYTPTTPRSNSPNDNPNDEEITDPKDIPVPTDDDDEFVAEDQCLIQKDKLVRIHHQPRYEAFDPSYCNDCPVNILCISGERFSTGNALPNSNCGCTMTLGEKMTVIGKWINPGLE